MVRRLLFLPIVALLLAACSTGSHDMMDDLPSANGAYSATDIMFAEMMIPHHEQAITMSNLALERSSNADVRALAQEILDAQGPEIEQMRAWGATGDEHSGHQMMGMLSDEQIAELGAATGAEFDRLFLEGMIAHHEGAIDMAQMILASKNDEVRSLGESIVESQTAEIERMRALVAALT